MSDSPLSCDFPETDIEQQLEKRFYRTHDERLASPPARKVDGVSDSSHELNYAIAFINYRFVDVRTAFLEFRRFQLVPVNIFMITVLTIMWFVDQFFGGIFRNGRFSASLVGSHLSFRNDFSTYLAS